MGCKIARMSRKTKEKRGKEGENWNERKRKCHERKGGEGMKRKGSQVDAQQPLGSAEGNGKSKVQREWTEEQK